MNSCPAAPSSNSNVGDVQAGAGSVGTVGYNLPAGRVGPAEPFIPAEVTGKVAVER